MSDFLQLRGKRRISDNGFLDLLEDKSHETLADRETKKAKLKELLQSWLDADGYLKESASLTRLITRGKIGDSIMRRMSSVSGHMWIEFREEVEDPHQDDSVYTGSNPRDEKINAHIVEFIPQNDEEIFGQPELDPEQVGINWDEITGDDLRKLFSHLKVGANKRRIDTVISNRSPAALLNGDINLLSPDNIQEHNQAWFDDRQDAFRTPLWPVSQPVKTFQGLEEQQKKKNKNFCYSLTPEYYLETHNCVTWGSEALKDSLFIDWLDTIRTQIPAANTIANSKDDEYDIKVRGLMWRAVLYLKVAHDERRLNRLRIFP
ncbi:MAG: hypothetical protein WBV94_32390 [Blastocatellia bacterium]